ncbi:hypothetical protein NYY94_18960, partial [Acinetobacter baumannii]|nr:hypothetical protein [Acinetobacter baumannii]
MPQGPEKTTTEASASSDPSPAPPETVTSSPSLSSPSTANPSAQPPAKPDPRTEAQIIADLVTAHIDGLAISPTNDPAVV